MVSLKQIPKISPSSYRRREAARCLLTDFPWIEKYSKITIEVAGYYACLYSHSAKPIHFSYQCVITTIRNNHQKENRPLFFRPAWFYFLRDERGTFLRFLWRLVEKAKWSRKNASWIRRSHHPPWGCIFFISIVETLLSFWFVSPFPFSVSIWSIQQQGAAVQLSVGTSSCKLENPVRDVTYVNFQDTCFGTSSIEKDTPKADCFYFDIGIEKLKDFPAFAFGKKVSFHGPLSILPWY